MTHPPSPAPLGTRLRAGALGIALSGLASYLAWRNLRHETLAGWIFWVPITVWLLTMALLSWWAALRGAEPTTRARIGQSWRIGWITGGLGLVLGFVGPLLVTPKANLGPLLGILITGPAGFVLGALGGAVVGSHANRR
ncbi:MAG TPA: hypothetical protein VFM14_09325 [Gemmatimonadales bacterium]|nr:hypothetical protein [Gemmatimonadales bacterium]